LGFFPKIQNWLSKRSYPLVLLIVTFVFSLPAFWVGYQLDDNLQRLILLKPNSFDGFLENKLDLFTFVSGEPEITLNMMDRGILPWWTVKYMKARIWRPLTVMIHWFDYRVLPDIAPLLHLHSLFWYGALIISVLLLYRKFVTPIWIAGLAALWFVLDDAHG